MQRHFAPVLGACLLASAVAMAADAPPPAQHARDGACRGDVQQFCKDVGHGQGQVRDCLMKNKDKLSQGCKDAIASAQARRAAEHGATSQATPPAQPMQPAQPAPPAKPN
jgi:Cysteine rich repeat